MAAELAPTTVTAVAPAPTTRIKSSTSAVSIPGYPHGHLGHLSHFERDALERFKFVLEESGLWISIPSSHDDGTLLWVEILCFRTFIVNLEASRVFIVLVLFSTSIAIILGTGKIRFKGVRQADLIFYLGVAVFFVPENGLFQMLPGNFKPRRNGAQPTA